LLMSRYPFGVASDGGLKGPHYTYFFTCRSSI
jgi:hypothetical protein